MNLKVPHSLSGMVQFEKSVQWADSIVTQLVESRRDLKQEDFLVIFCMQVYGVNK